jgi:hypothetical protein
MNNEPITLEEEQVNHCIEDEEVGENGEHNCIDGTDGTQNIDGTTGNCITCGLTELI